MAGLPCGKILAAGNSHLEFADARTERSTLETLTTGEIGALGVTLELPEVLESRERRLVGSRARLAALLWVSAAALGLYLGSERIDAAASIQKYQSRWDVESR